MPARPTPLSQLRHALQWAIGAAVAAGVFWGGGYPADEPGLSMPRSARRPAGPAEERWVRREAARGLADLERFLAQQPHG